MSSQSSRFAAALAGVVLLAACSDDPSRGSITQTPVPRTDVASVGWTVTRTELCTQGSCNGFAADINNYGVVVGGFDRFPFSGPFIWSKATGIRPLVANRQFIGAAYGINDKKTVVGTGYNADKDRTEAWMWTEATGLRWLGTLGGNYSAAYKVNLDNQVVGLSKNAAGQMHAVRWRPTGIDDLGPSFAQANDINKDGYVAAALGVPNAHAVVVKPSFSLDFGTFGRLNGVAMSINGSRTIVGYGASQMRDPFDMQDVVFAFDARAFVSSTPGFIRGIPPLPGGEHNAAFGVNDRGDVVGWSEWDDQIQFNRDAFFWSSASGSIQLERSASSGVSFGYSINEDRQIAGATINCCSWTPVVWRALPPAAK